MSATNAAIASLQAKIWDGSLPLEIRLAASDCCTYDESESYLVQYPRLSYLSFLLPRVFAFFKSSLIDPEATPYDAWFSFQGVPLKWHYPLGLLYDLLAVVEPVDAEDAAASKYPRATEDDNKDSEPLPFKLTIHYTEFPGDILVRMDPDEQRIFDSYINGVKEADFIRNGNSRTVMSLSKEDTNSLWQAVMKHDRKLYNSINNKLLNPPGVRMRHVPLKLYLPSSAEKPATETAPEDAANLHHVRVIQTLVATTLPSRQSQTLGTALNSVLEPLFPSRRALIHARPVLHGVVVPMAANLMDLGKAASYKDGFLHIVVVMLS